MASHEDHQLPEDLHGIAGRLRRERAEATPLELDRMKLLAMNRAAKDSSAVRSKGRPVRSRLVSPVLAAALLLGGFAGIVAGTGEIPLTSGGSNASSANSQYCPPSSPAAGKPKKQPGVNMCGQPTTTTTATTTSTTTTTTTTTKKKK